MSRRRFTSISVWSFVMPSISTSHIVLRWALWEWDKVSIFDVSPLACSKSWSYLWVGVWMTFHLHSNHGSANFMSLFLLSALLSPSSSMMPPEKLFGGFWLEQHGGWSFCFCLYQSNIGWRAFTLQKSSLSCGSLIVLPAICFLLEPPPLGLDLRLAKATGLCFDTGNFKTI